MTVKFVAPLALILCNPFALPDCVVSTTESTHLVSRREVSAVGEAKLSFKLRLKNWMFAILAILRLGLAILRVRLAI